MTGAKDLQEIIDALLLAQSLITGWIPAKSDDQLKIDNAVIKAKELLKLTQHG